MQLSPFAERRRLDAVTSYDLAATPSENEYDGFATIAARMFSVPISLISIVGDEEEWLKAHVGLAASSVPRATSFGEHTLDRDAPLIVRDAAADPRFAANPLVVGAPHVRFYAGAPLINAAGEHLGALCIMDTEPRPDFTKAQEALLVSVAALVMARMEKRRRFRLGRAVTGFADATAIAIVTADAAGRITFWNRAAEHLFGHPVGEVLGRPLDIIVPERFRAEHHAAMRRLAEGGAPRLAGKTVEVVASRSDGSEFPIELAISMWQGCAGAEFGAMIQDITERREREGRLQHLADHDPLTGLPNRDSFKDMLSAHLHEHGAAALLLIDLDSFKSINDAFGHAVGDALLQTIAIRFATVAGSDGGFARLGNDDFALLLPHGSDEASVEAVAELLDHAFRRPFRIAGHLLQVGLSMGAATIEDGSVAADELLLRADLAQSAAKRAGGRAFRFFNEGMQRELVERRAAKDELRLALARGQWRLHYQSQIDRGTGALVGAEALLRWCHPTRGLLAPAAFLPVLETHKVAYEVGSWVLDEACRQLVEWRRAGLELPRISVNLFAAQFTSGDLGYAVRSALQRHGLSAADIEIEVTECIALRPDDQIVAVLRQLRDAGVHIALDDFGTGFASLTTLKQVPVTRLKVDRSFVHDIDRAPHSAAIVAAIVSLASRLRLEVVVEGVETEKQAAVLAGLGCEVMQGFLFAMPVSADEFLARHRGRNARGDAPSDEAT